MPTVLIAGGSGLVGTRLSQLLAERNYTVLHLSRNGDLQAKPPAYQWDLTAGTVDTKAIVQADYVINLAGAGIADRLWTKARKKVIIDSRVKSNKVLQAAFEKMDKKPKAYISASAVGYYGDKGEELVQEEAAPGTGFLTDSVQQWEQSIQPITQSSIRTVVLRIGIVLSTKGGAFQKMFPSYKVNVGAYFGDGQQYYSWIHIDDLCEMFIWAIEKDTVEGIFNAVGPRPATLKTIARSIAKAMDKKALIVPAPAPALRLAMGEMADMLLFSTRVSSQKIENWGFRFQFPALESAIRDVLKRKV